MADYKDIFKARENQNWFKSCLACHITRAGIKGFISDEFKQFHESIIDDVILGLRLPKGSSCNRCTTQNVVTCPTFGLCSRSKVCKYHNSPPNYFKPCPTRMCHDIRDKIDTSHCFKKPSWKNTEAKNWCKNSWEIAKCYMPPDGYTMVTTVDETDFNGLISVLINCTRFQKMSYNLRSTVDVLSEARVVGRTVRHSPALQMSDADFSNNLKALSALLSEQTFLASNTDAIEALANLKKLETDTLVISSQDVSKVLANAITLVDEHKTDGISEINREVVEHLEKVRIQIKEEEEKSLKEIRLVSHSEIQNITTIGTANKQSVEQAGSIALKKIDDVYEDMYNDMYSGLDSRIYQAKRAIRQQQFAAIKSFDKRKARMLRALRKRRCSDDDDMYATFSSSDEDSDDDEGCTNRKTALQRHLLETYMTRYIKADTRPWSVEDVEFDDIFAPVPTEICDELRNRVESIDEIFGGSSDSNHNILLTGKAGMGKTMFCQHLMSAWCRAHSNNSNISKRKARHTNKNKTSQSNAAGKVSTIDIQLPSNNDQNQDNDLETEVELEKTNWIKTFQKNVLFMKQIDYLFYVSVRHLNKEKNAGDLIASQLLRDYPKHINTLKDVLEKDPESCLVIIDGLNQTVLDSSIVLSIALSDDVKHCLKLSTTCSSLVTDELSSKFDTEIQIKAIGSKQAMFIAERYICQVCKSINAYKALQDFKTEAYEKVVACLDMNPLLLKLLVYTWYDQQLEHFTTTGIYSDIVRMELRSLEKHIGESEPEDTAILEDVVLPPQLEIPSASYGYARMCVALGKSALESFMNSDQLVVDSETLKANGLGHEDIEHCVRSCLLTKGSIDPTNVSLLSYPSETFKTFFAAIAACQSPTHLQHFLENYETPEDMMKCSTILTFASGLNVNALDAVAEYLYRCPNFISVDRDFPAQDIVFSCMKETLSQVTVVNRIPLRDLYVHDTVQKDYLGYINPNMVKTLLVNVNEALLSESDFKNVLEMQTLESLVIDDSCNQSTATASDTIAKMINATCLKNLTLIACNGEAVNASVLTNPLTLRDLYLSDMCITHSTMTRVLCELPTLENVVVSYVDSPGDAECGCIATEDTQPDERPPRVMTCKVCHVVASSGIFRHITSSPNMRAITYENVDLINDTDMLSLLPSCSQIRDICLRSVSTLNNEMRLSPDIRSLKRIEYSGVFTCESFDTLIESVPKDHPAVVLDLRSVTVLDSDADKLKDRLEAKVHAIRVVEWEPFSDIPNKFQALLMINKNIRHKPTRCAMKKASMGFGFDVSTRPDLVGVVVSAISETEPFIKGGVSEGDQILYVNNADLRLATREKAETCIACAGETYEMTLQFSPEDYIQIVQMVCVERYRWWVDSISREDTELLLQMDKKVGAFVVRQSEDKMSLVLSLRCKEDETPNKCVQHCRIFCTENGQYCLDQKSTFNSLPELIRHYETSDEGLSCRLTGACSSNRSMIQLYRLGETLLDRQTIELSNQLGKGHFSEVYLGKWNIGTEVAVKVIRQIVDKQNDHVLEEVRIHSLMKHNHVVKLIGACADKDSLWIVTELMTNGSLLSFLRLDQSAEIHIDGLLNMATQVADAMTYLETEHIVHRDLRADNILVGPNNILKLSDFGLAMILSSDTYTSKSSVLQFPVKWTAPEAVLYRTFNAKSDVWSFGVLLYEFITFGEVPYPGMSKRETMKEIEKGYRMPKPVGKYFPCPDQYYDMMVQCWDQEPRCRPTFALILDFFQKYQPDVTNETLIDDVVSLDDEMTHL